MQQGKLIIVTAPSGAGKTTIVKHLLEVIPQLAFSVSATSRPARAKEEHGRDYYFFSPEEFARLIQEDAFLEWEEVYEGRYYGTLREEVERLWAAGKHIIFDIDVKGAINLQGKYPERTRSLFIKPPSREVLEERLRSRASETEATLQRRLERARFELSCEDQFHRTVVNDQLPVALKEAEHLVRSFLEEEEE